jgi:hypothetical protein
MNASDARQVICRRKKERRSFEQSFYQAFFEKMKKHVKRISSKESTQSLRDVDERHHV